MQLSLVVFFAVTLSGCSRNDQTPDMTTTSTPSTTTLPPVRFPAAYSQVLDSDRFIKQLDPFYTLPLSQFVQSRQMELIASFVTDWDNQPNFTVFGFNSSMGLYGVLKLYAVVSLSKIDGPERTVQLDYATVSVANASTIEKALPLVKEGWSSETWSNLDGYFPVGNISEISQAVLARLQPDESIIGLRVYSAVGGNDSISYVPYYTLAETAQTEVAQV